MKRVDPSGIEPPERPREGSVGKLRLRVKFGTGRGND
jgi:hypothetical protein